MRIVKKILPIVIALTMVLSVPVASSAATKKEVYVLTKYNEISYEEDSDGTGLSIKLSYDENGLIKKAIEKDADGWWKIKTNFYYGKKSQISKASATEYVLDEKYDAASRKFSYNKNGMISSIKTYNAKGQSIGTKKRSFDKKNHTKKIRIYNSKGKLTETIKFTRNKSGEATKRKTYNAKGKLKYTVKYKWAGKECTFKVYNAKGKLIESGIHTYKNGNLVKILCYDETKNHKLIFKAVYTYKKIKTAKKSAVSKQQYLIEDTVYW